MPAGESSLLSRRGPWCCHLPSRPRGSTKGPAGPAPPPAAPLEGPYSHRHIADISEVRYRAYRHWEFFPREGRWLREDNGEEGELGSSQPLDDVAFVYYVRTLPLRVGDVYTLPRYFRESGNPVVVRVLRKDRITVPAGTFNTVVVQPIIRTRGLFSEGGKAEIHFSDDHRRILVQMQSRLSFGSLSLHLRSLEEGEPLRPLRP